MTVALGALILAEAWMHARQYFTGFPMHAVGFACLLALFVGFAGRELYNHDNDPEEVNNLALDPKYAKVVNKLADRLQAYKKR